VYYFLVNGGNNLRFKIGMEIETCIGEEEESSPPCDDCPTCYNCRLCDMCEPYRVREALLTIIRDIAGEDEGKELLREVTNNFNCELCEDIDSRYNTWYRIVEDVYCPSCCRCDYCEYGDNSTSCSTSCSAVEDELTANVSNVYIDGSCGMEMCTRPREKITVFSTT